MAMKQWSLVGDTIAQEEPLRKQHEAALKAQWEVDYPGYTPEEIAKLKEQRFAEETAALRKAAAQRTFHALSPEQKAEIKARHAAEKLARKAKT